jgi:hypothetical protein
MDEGGQKTPSPAVPAPVDLKCPAPKARDLDFFILLLLSPEPVRTASPGRPQQDIFSGFAGVPASVAFCTFVI